LADRIGVQADSYVLCNPPYSLVEDNLADDWAQRYVSSENGRTGRETYAARTRTLKHFFDMMRQRMEPLPAPVNMCQITEFANPKTGEPFTFDRDQAKYGLNGQTHGRVTLYCCPHDQVIGVTTIQGIGWRGLSTAEIEATHGQGVFTQRVFAHNYTVGQAPSCGEEPHYYGYYSNHWRNKEGFTVDENTFWSPASPRAKVRIGQGWYASSTLGKLASVFLFPLLLITKAVLEMKPVPLHGSPPKGWKIPIAAPELPEPFQPIALRFGKASPQFDEGHDPAGNARMSNEAQMRSIDQAL
jgi:hypothetical protein